jgi:glycosyltransferase involved in cell wall biosynthesis
MRIAILGTRGIPNHYGGFEQYAQQLSVYLVRKGWEVTVYSSSQHPYQEKQYEGVAIRHRYDPEHRIGTMGQFLYDLACIRDARRQKFDIVYQLGYTSSAIFNFLFPEATCLVTNMDGMEWKRTKYSRPVQRFLRYSEKLVVLHSDALVADSIAIKAYLQSKYGISSYYSAYTAVVPAQKSYAGTLAGSLLSEGDYNLVIARLEQENNVEPIIKAHLQSGTGRLLVVVGSFHTKFGKYLHEHYAGGHIRFVGGLFDKQELDALRRGAGLYFHGHSVGGTNPSLLEAMACGCRILAHDNEFNRAVLGNDAWYFHDAGSLASLILSAGEAKGFFKEAVQRNEVKIREQYAEEHVFKLLMQQMEQWRTSKK